MTIYHVTPAWDGCDLESLYRQHGGDEGAAIDAFLDRWGDDASPEIAGVHVHFVHCHATLELAVWDAERRNDIAMVLAINEDLLDEPAETDRDEYPHPIVRGRIPAEAITYVREG